MTGAKQIDPIAAATGLITKRELRFPWEIRIELLAFAEGACTLWRDAGSADARVIRSGDLAYLAISRYARGTPRARFSIAHELGHFLMHGNYDAIARIHGKAQLSGRDYLIEDQANRFASEILVPTSMAAPMCVASLPSLDHVGELARTFDVSLTVAAQRWAQMASAPCAFVESRGGIIKRAIRSSAFRGIAVQRHAIEEGTLAFETARTGRIAETRRHTHAWGGYAMEAEIVEQSIPITDDGVVLTWLAHR